MAAVYIHNALFSPEMGYASPNSSSSGSRPLSGSHSHGRGAHQRTLSSHSTVTLTTTTTHTHPTDSILHSSPSVSSAYHDLLARQPPHPAETPPDWDAGLRLDASPLPVGEARGYRAQTRSKRLRRLRMAQVPLGLVIGSWATYTTIRYFITFSFADAHDVEIICLALGTSSAVSLALAIACYLLSTFAPLSWRPSRTLSVLTRILLPYLSSIFLIAPAVVNLVFVVLLRRKESVWQVNGTCAWDVDIIWVGNGSSTCDDEPRATWAAWLAGAIARLVLTIAICVSYHALCHVYNRALNRSRSHASRRYPRPMLMGPPVSLPVSPALQPILHTASPPMSPGNLSPYYSPIHSRSTRASFASDTGMPPIGADRRSLRSSRSRIASTKDGLHALSRNSLSSSGHGHRSTEEDDSDSEERGGSSVETVTAGPRPGLWRSRSSSDGGHQSGSEHSSRHGHATIELQESQDVEMMDFVDRFRSLVTQITRETEEGMDFAREAGDGTMLRHRVISLDEDNSEDSSSRSDGRSMTPEDYISMLGGYVRRMPTIESLGSREVMSLANSKGGQSGSRPPTRANTLSMSDQGSQPPSRSNSLNWRQLDAVAANNGAGESIGREATPQSHSHSGSGSQRSVVRSASITSRRSILTTSSPVDSPVQIEFPASHEQLEES